MFPNKINTWKLSDGIVVANRRSNRCFQIRNLRKFQRLVYLLGADSARILPFDSLRHSDHLIVSHWALRCYVHCKLRRGWRLPATAECTDQVDTGPQLQGIKTERLQLGLQDGGLRGDDGEIVCRALSVERHGKVERALRRVDGGLLIQRSVVVMIECGQTVFDLLERADNDTAVVRGRGVVLGARLGDLRPAQAAIEHGE